tara:strand:- start:4332 stop:5435 length:1104 start_codon:yes stop_codon:yes gene_type:complete
MLKIVHITFDMRIGGTEMVIRNIIEGMQNSSFEMSVFCIESPLGPWGNELQHKGIPITNAQRSPGFDISLIKQIRRYVRENNIDIVHCHQYTPWVYGALATCFTKTKVIFTEHGRFYPDSTSWKRKLVNPLLVSLTDKITSISNATKQALTEFESIPASKIQTIYNGIHPLKCDHQNVLTLRDTLGIPRENKILGTIARFDPIKNHQMMLEAFSVVLVSHPNTTLIMVGDGEERGNIEKLIRELNIGNNIILTGYQSSPTHFLALMDIFLLSSLSEGTSMTLLEAMSLSKPCVVTDAGGNAEIVLNGETGVVTPNDDANSFAQGINDLLSNGYSTLSLNAKRRFEAYFSEQIMNTHYQDAYLSLNND